MATNNGPTITNDIIVLLEEMRSAQREWEDLVNDRDGKATQHQIRRSLQAKKSIEHKVDVWLANYQAELQSYLRAMEAHKTDEIPGLYETRTKE